MLVDIFFFHRQIRLQIPGAYKDPQKEQYHERCKTVILDLHGING